MLSLLTAGAETELWVKLAPEEVLLGVVTVVELAMPAWTTALMSVSEKTVKLAGVVPKLTSVAPVKLLPTKVMVLPPTAPALDGLTLLIDGDEAAL
jgi:hypothetical protein